MGKEVGVEYISFENKDFWLFYLAFAHRDGYDEISGLNIWEIFIFEKMSSKWINEFTGYYDGIFEESDGYLENPNKLKVNIKDQIYFIIEFHAGDIYYFINDINIGNSGPHWKLLCFSWNEFIRICKNSNNGKYLFHLLLPLVLVNIKEISVAKQAIKDNIKEFEFLDNCIDELVNCILCGISSEYLFYNDEKIGNVCDCRYSVRYSKSHDINKIKILNSYIQKII